MIAIIEVKTTIDSARFQQALDYFRDLKSVAFKPTYLFIYQAEELDRLSSFFTSYEENQGEYMYDHHTFQYLPDEITGIDNSYHLKQDYVDDGSDKIGYSSFYYTDQKDTAMADWKQYFNSQFLRYSAIPLFST